MQMKTSPDMTLTATPQAREGLRQLFATKFQSRPLDKGTPPRDTTEPGLQQMDELIVLMADIASFFVFFFLEQTQRGRFEEPKQITAAALAPGG